MDVEGKDALVAVALASVPKDERSETAGFYAEISQD